MTDCLKRQTEVRKGIEQYRCLNPEATTHKQLVVLTQCAVCPVQVLRKPDGPPCKQKNLDSPLPVPGQHVGYPDCPLRYDLGGKLTCSVTGLEVTPEICHRCDEKTRTETATWGDRAMNYLMAIRRWVASGQPMRTKEEVAELFKNHCGAGCERYDPDNHACKTCGCSVSATTSDPLENKLRMATEHCPLGRF